MNSSSIIWQKDISFDLLPCLLKNVSETQFAFLVIKDDEQYSLARIARKVAKQDNSSLKASNIGSFVRRFQRRNVTLRKPGDTRQAILFVAVDDINHSYKQLQVRKSLGYEN